MQKFDKSAAWDDVKLLLSSHSSLVWAIAGVFIFLPQLLFGFIMPAQDPAAQAGLTPEAQLEVMQNMMMQMLPLALILGLVSAIGNAAILRLWLARSEISVGDALKTGAGLVITLFLIQILTSIALFFGFLALIIPFFYLWARFFVAQAYAVDRNERNPLTAMKASWALTKGQVWPVFVLLLLLMLATVVVVMLLSIFAGLFAIVPAVGIALSVVAQGAISTAVLVFFAAVTAAVYRQLVVIQGAEHSLL